MRMFEAKEIIAKIDSISLEQDAEFTKITFNRLSFKEPALDELFILLNTETRVRLLILPDNTKTI